MHNAFFFIIKISNNCIPLSQCNNVQDVERHNRQYRIERERERECVMWLLCGCGEEILNKKKTMMCFVLMWKLKKEMHDLRVHCNILHQFRFPPFVVVVSFFFCIFCTSNDKPATFHQLVDVSHIQYLIHTLCKFVQQALEITKK